LAPSDRERTQYYFQRYIEHLPAAGEIVFFDRSWYNRAGVERVMGFCTPHEVATFLRLTPDLEAGFVESGLRLVKLYLAINREEQIKRLKARESDPLKAWKLSPIDAEAPSRWDDYTQAQNEMFRFTHTHAAPWTVINANDKRAARINAIRHVLESLPYEGKDGVVAVPPDPSIVGSPFDIWPDLANEQ
jgi:polyphosphate kinase 2